MILDLPPIKQIQYGEDSVRAVYNTMTSLIVGHNAAHTTYRFYEVIDQWLGPWGENGYPIAYGKFYNIVFNTNKKLAGNAAASAWVRKTTILLQQSVRDYIILRMRRRNLAMMTEPELRAAAFDSHARCYTDGGLAQVMVLAPELVPVIALLPLKEFNPLGPNFKATISQVFETMGRVAAISPSFVIRAMVGPVHQGLFARASRQDAVDRLGPQRMALGLARIGRMIDAGEFDDLAALKTIIERLQRMEFSERIMGILADKIIDKARRRSADLTKYYHGLLIHSPALQDQFAKKLKGLIE